MSSAFQISAKFSEIAKVINLLPTDKFAVILKRILKRLHLKGSLFDTEEVNQLLTVFNLTTVQLQNVLDCCCYIFEQAAFTSTGPEPLFTILMECGFSETHSKMFGKVWMTDAPDFIAKLKNKSLGYTSLESFSHSMDVNLASSGLTRQSDPTAIYQFNLSASGGKKNSPGECVTAEFSHDELYSFLMQLDQVQSQLDALAST